MKVLMLGWEFPPEISGGLGVACNGLAYGLSRQNVAIDFVLPAVKAKKTWNKVTLRETAGLEWNKVLTEESHWEEDIKVLEIGSYLLPYVSPEQFTEPQTVPDVREKKIVTETLLPLKTKLKGGYGPDLFSEVSKYAIAIGEEARHTKADLIHAHDWMTFHAGILAKAASGLPLVVHCHSTEIDRSGPFINQHIYDIERRGFERADMVIAVSNLTSGVLQRHYGVPCEKIRVVHNGYFSVEKKAASGRKGFSVSFLGRMVGQKGPGHFVDVARELVRLDESYRFTMGGEGPMLHSVREKVNRMNLGPFFSFPGFVSPKQLPKFFADADLFLMTSNSDPFGLVALEALSAGVPVVLSNKAGVAEVISHAATFDPWDTFSIRNFIHELARSPSRFKKYAAEQQKDLPNASWEKMGEEVASIYAQLVQ